MTRHYMSLTEVAELLGITKGALSTLNLPEPDVTVGRARGWSRETVEKWNAERPGSGRRDSLPRRTKKMDE